MTEPLTDAELDALRAEIATWKQGVLNLLDSFNATCIALNGEPSPELGEWTPAMLPEKAAALREQNAKLVAALELASKRLLTVANEGQGRGRRNEMARWAGTGWREARGTLASVKGEQG